MDLYTLLYLKWITNKDLLYSTGNFAQCYVAAWMGGGLGENRYMYMAESLCHSPETITTLLIKIKIQYNQYKIKNLKKKCLFSKWEKYPGATCLCSVPIQLPMRTPPLHINLEDNCVFKDEVTHLMECSLEGKILQLSLK